MPIRPIKQCCIVWLILACAGCATTPIPFLREPIATLKSWTKSQSERTLDNGIKSYEEGDYKTAAKQLQTSLDLGLTSEQDQSDAHKYLAFIYCTSSRKNLCRGEFRKAFDSNPEFDLKPTEAGHPMWGPVFRSVKAEMTKQAKRRT